MTLRLRYLTEDSSAHMGLAATSRGGLSIKLERKGKANKYRTNGALAGA
jgi:hypothetical protein